MRSHSSFEKRISTYAAAVCALAMCFSMALVMVVQQVQFKRALNDRISAISGVASQQLAEISSKGNIASRRIVLDAFQAEKSIDQAGVYNRDGALIAAYSPDEASEMPHRIEAKPSIPFVNVVFKTRDGQHETLQVRYRGAGLMPSLVSTNLFLWLGLMFIGAATAKVTTKHAFKGLLQPLGHMLSTAKAIKQRRDFSMRLSVESSGELGELISGFNDLIEEVGNRDAALQKDRMQMEQRVRERTATLNDELSAKEAEIKAIQDGGVEAAERVKELEKQVSMLTEALEKKSREVPVMLPKTIFLYDLDSTSSKILTGYLGASGHTVTSFASNRDLERQSTEFDPEAFVIDLDSENALSTVEYIAGIAKAAQYRIVCLTAHDRAAELSRFANAHQVLKPVRREALLRALNGESAAPVNQHAPVTAETSTAPAKSLAGLNGLRVLLAEDNPVNQKVAIHTLLRMGCTVEAADNGKIALEMLENGEFDIILMDLQMPEMDGLEATSAIRIANKPYKNIPIVALTANAMVGDKERCIQAGMDDYLSKPLKPANLMSILERFQTDRVA